MSDADAPPPGPRRLWLRGLPLVLLLAISLGVAMSGGSRLLDLDQIAASRAWLQEAVAADRTRAIGLTALVFVCGVVVSLPAVTLVLTALSGLLFGTVTGALIAIGSATTGALLVFSIGRFAAGDLIRRKAGPRLGRFADGFRRDGFGYVLILRLLPIFPFWITNLAPAAFGVTLRSFAVATVLGLAPGAFVYAGLGAGLEDLMAARDATRIACLEAGGSDCAVGLDLRGLVSPTMIAALAGLAGLAGLSVYLRRRVERRALRA
ncbi:TVP38/TMEM64 family protein [Methylobacterium sp. Leaf118]|uniref:TVP38/TMEM64 family protein n=1 Tax=Methylobacterium sp. Leaf118 TaxID=2876562 RepID=UPI001E2F5E89|nr:VTT domain-containing protein [Methylobacterium sp. Leaf118]